MAHLACSDWVDPSNQCIHSSRASFVPNNSLFQHYNYILLVRVYVRTYTGVTLGVTLVAGTNHPNSYLGIYFSFKRWVGIGLLLDGD